jgi:hypothetical protein
LRRPVLGQLRLLVIDPQSRITLWNITGYVRGAVRLGNRDKNFDQAMNPLVDRAQRLMVGPPASPKPQ